MGEKEVSWKSDRPENAQSARWLVQTEGNRRLRAMQRAAAREDAARVNRRRASGIRRGGEKR